MRPRNGIGLAGALVLALAAAPAGWTADRPPVSRDQPALVLADELVYERELDIVIARGNVEVSQNDRVLKADTVTYNRRTDIVTASGNVALIEPTGEVVFGDYMEITGDMKDGFGREVRMLLQDNWRVAANGGTLVQGTRTNLDQAVFSPCDLCAKDPTRPPVWQIKARKVTHDKVAKDMIYRDATLEMFGVPVLYTPYLEHPDPSVKQRSGVLSPEMGMSRALGFSTMVPYYIALSPSNDLTLMPRVMTKAGFAMGAEYRQRFDRGWLDAEGSATVDSGDFRGHLFSRGQFEIDDYWRTGYQLQRATDETYLKRYGYSSPSYLQSEAYVEGFFDRSYVTARSYAFQELRTDVNDRETPIVTPLMQAEYIGDPGFMGARFEAAVSAANIMRKEGADSTKLSVKGGWMLPYTSSWGDIWRLGASVQGDIYDVRNQTDPDNPSRSFDGATGRVLPQVTVDWRWPFVRRDTEDGSHLLVEPMVSVAVAPTLGRQWKIPNEDSVDQVFDETNLFNPNRFSGTDRLEGGQRVTYGGRFGLFEADGSSSTLFMGQTFRFNSRNVFNDNKESKSHFSDYVAAVDLNPGPFWNAFARIRLDDKSFKPRQTDLLASAGPSWLRLWTSYIAIDDNLTSFDSFGDRKELSFGATSKVNDFWSVGSYITRDMEAKQTRSYGANVRYEDECFVFFLSAERRLYEDRDVTPDTRVLFQIVFKQVASVRSRIF